MTNHRPFKFRVWYYDQKKFDRNVKFEDFQKYSFPLYWGCVQQFTGMIDSTGKDVYEGDIVCGKMTDEIAFAGEECNMGRVFFAAGTFMIDGDGPLYDHTYSLTPDKLEDYLVVGNIFENPELLK